MSPASIRERVNRDGSISCQVRFRLGGAAFKPEHAGTFRGYPGGKDPKTGRAQMSVTTARKLANTRRDLVAGWLAAGKDPRVELAKLQNPRARTTLAEAFDQFVRSRHDVGASRINNYKAARQRIVAFFDDGKQDPWTITTADCRLYVAWLREQVNPRTRRPLKPSTVRDLYGPLQLVLDFLEIEPNPARSRTVKLPPLERDEPEIITRAQFQAMLEHVTPKYVLFFRVIEATGMRIGELVHRTWGDVNFDDSALRLGAATTKTRRPRWVPVPRELMDEIAALVPVEARSADRRVFPFTTAGPRTAMRDALRKARVPAFSPHDFRHRRASLWLFQAVPSRLVQEWGGWANQKVLNETYSHVVVDPLDDDWYEETMRRLRRSLPARLERVEDDS